MRIFRN